MKIWTMLVVAVCIVACYANADVTTSTVVSDMYYSASSGTYAGARDTTESANSGAAYNVIGQRKLGSTYQVCRTFMAFPIPILTAATECTLFVYGREDDSDTDFQVYVHGARAAAPALTKADYPNFNGMTIGGAHIGTILNNAYTVSTNYVDNTWNGIVLNAAGLDSLVAASNDTLWLVMVSKEDYDNSAPTNPEYVVFESDYEEGKEPYLSFNYTPGGWTGKFGGITNPTKIMGVETENISKVMGIP